jgi:hypothetical protein
MQMMEAFKWIIGKDPIKNQAARMRQYPKEVPREERMQAKTGRKEHTDHAGC